MVNNLLGSDGENIWLGVQLGSEEVVWLRCSDLINEVPNRRPDRAVPGVVLPFG
jgi:hypothetical protein